ncbi:MAG: hydrogenase iron-sulfur subunit [Deltaproteobacteria bacterium]|nr:MAG: hydrogenase iron-sulfur subunit [Deltaproteobacteria bacterium]
MQYTTDIRIIRVMCTGRVDPTMIAEAFINDADGVMVVGCHFGDCHYITGNVQGQIKVGLAERVLTYVGLSPKRVSFDQCSSAEGERFVKLVTDFNQGVRELGPLGNGDGLPAPELKEKLSIAKTILAKEKLRWVVGKFTVFVTEGNKYGEVFTDHEMWRTLDTIVMDEVATHQIMRELGQEAVAVKDLAARLKLPAPDVLRYVLALQRRELVDLDGVEGNSPRYKAVGPTAQVA